MTVTGPAITLQVKDYDMVGILQALPARDHISLLPAHRRGESHSQMEGSRPRTDTSHCPDIALLTTALKSVHRNMTVLSTRTGLSCGNSWSRAAGNDGILDCSAASLPVAGLREVCCHAKAAALPDQMIAGLKAPPFA
jgi:hypothetical protein